MTMMAYTKEHRFSPEAWKNMHEHFDECIRTTEVSQKSFIESCLYCLNKSDQKLSPELLQACEKQLKFSDLSLSNKIALAGIFSKNKYLGPLFKHVIEEMKEKPLSELLKGKAQGYDKFGFEQAALLLNAMRSARIVDIELLSKMEEYILVREGQLQFAPN